MNIFYIIMEHIFASLSLFDSWFLMLDSIILSIMDYRKKVLVACLGKSDPCKMAGANPKTGPTLSLILNYLPSDIIFFVSKDMRNENRLQVTERVVNDLYKTKNIALPDFRIIDLDGDAEVYNYQHALKKVTNELRSLLANFDKDSTKFIFSKTSGTPQYKTALEIFPKLFLDGFDFEIIMKDQESGKKDSATCSFENIGSIEILNDILGEDLNIKEDVKRTINPSFDDLNIQTVFAKLQIFKELVKAYEYNSARTVLEGLFPYLLQGRKAEPELNWLNDIYEKDSLRRMYKSLDFARQLLAFEIGGNAECEVKKFIPAVNDICERRKNDTSKVKAEIAYRNFKIYEDKALHKEMVLSFAILLERLRKNSVKEAIGVGNEDDCKLFELNDHESILPDSVSPKFRDYHYDFIIHNDACIEANKHSSQKPNRDEPLKHFSLPVVESAAYFLYDICGVETATYRFYRELVSDKLKRSDYEKIAKLRNSLAHDFEFIGESAISATKNLGVLLKEVFCFRLEQDVYKEINKFILDEMFSIRAK